MLDSPLTVRVVSPAQGPYLEGRTLLVRVPEIRGALSQAVLSTSAHERALLGSPLSIFPDWWSP